MWSAPRDCMAGSSVLRAAAFWHGAAPLSRAPRSVEMVWSAPRDCKTGSSVLRAATFWHGDSGNLNNVTG